MMETMRPKCRGTGWDKGRQGPCRCRDKGGTGGVAGRLHHEHVRHFPTYGVACRFTVTHGPETVNCCFRLHFCALASIATTVRPAVDSRCSIHKKEIARINNSMEQQIEQFPSRHCPWKSRLPKRSPWSASDFGWERSHTAI